MNLFENFKKYLSLKKDLRKKYIPFFKKGNFYNKVEHINAQISEDLKYIYLILKSNEKKYKKFIKLYDDYLTSAISHNDDVDLIVKVVENFDFNKIIENPTLINSDALYDIERAKNILPRFRHVDKKYLKFAIEADDLCNNFEIINSQYKNYLIYNNLVNFNNQKYIDLENKETRLKQLQLINERMKSFKKHYYHFCGENSLKSLIEDYNRFYIDSNIKDCIFDNVNNRSLDIQQRESVLKDDISSLVVAGAGSGKTLTICAKVKYLLERENVNPSDILLLSYSKKSAIDLDDKISKINPKLTVGTFHKIGLSILKETLNKTFVVEEQYDSIIEFYFREELKKRENIRRKVMNYFAYFYNDTNFNEQYENIGEKFEDLKKQDFATIKNIVKSYSPNFFEKETIKKEYVKSFEEMMIANFLFLNGIKYEYEKPYEKDVSTIDKRQYLPDFFLIDYGIYIEHFGIDENGEASQLKGESGKQYIVSMEWKRNIHKMNKTKCIETFSYEFENQTIFKNLYKKFEELGIKINKISDKEANEVLNSIYHNQRFKSFINLVKSFLSLYKATYGSGEALESFKNIEFDNRYIEKRTHLFLDIVIDVYNFYISKIRENKKIDFDDMILLSTQKLNDTNKFNYKYIIVDEFQDISFSRMKLLNALIEKGNARLFAVGDDWQSIYRFAGCDLNIFLNFKDYFKYANLNMITTTHRNSQELQNIAGPFIKANPEQFNKTIFSAKTLQNPIKIMFYDEDKAKSFLNILDDIYLKNKNANILVLGRNNKDIETVLSNSCYLIKNFEDEKNVCLLYENKPSLNIKYTTVHSSKGLEEDYVIIINADDSAYGFPNKTEDDPLLNLVLSSKSNFPYAEERRLWYVALTRTRTYTYILASRDNPSIFVEEMYDKCHLMNKKVSTSEEELITCPDCKSGHLILRINKLNNTKFYSCSNAPLCKFTSNNLSVVKSNLKCPVCNDFLVKRVSKHGAFYGCSRYPYCDYTKPYNEDDV